MSMSTLLLVLSLVCAPLTPARIHVNGQDGEWLPTEQMSKLVQKADRADELEGVLKAQDTVNVLQARQIATASVAISSYKFLVNEQKLRGDEFKALAEKQSKAIEEAGAWYRSPVLWLGVGAGSAVVLFILVRGATPNINIQR